MKKVKKFVLTLSSVLLAQMVGWINELIGGEK